LGQAVISQGRLQTSASKKCCSFFLFLSYPHQIWRTSTQKRMNSGTHSLLPPRTPDHDSGLVECWKLGHAGKSRSFKLEVRLKVWFRLNGTWLYNQKWHCLHRSILISRSHFWWWRGNVPMKLELEISNES
jgi:hypothetical protein